MENKTEDFSDGVGIRFMSLLSSLHLFIVLIEI